MKNSQFKNWHGRQFLNRILGRNIRGFEQQAEWIEYLNMLVSIKILARILMLHIGCTFGEWRHLSILVCFIYVDKKIKIKLNRLHKIPIILSEGFLWCKIYQNKWKLF